MPVPLGYCSDRKHLRLTTQPIVTEKEKLELNKTRPKACSFYISQNKIGHISKVDIVHGVR